MTLSAQPVRSAATALAPLVILRYLHTRSKPMAHTLQIPTELINKFLRASAALDNLHDALEDFLIVNNPALLRKLRKARREDQAGKTRPFEEFERELGRTRSSK